MCRCWEGREEPRLGECPNGKPYLPLGGAPVVWSGGQHVGRWTGASLHGPQLTWRKSLSVLWKGERLHQQRRPMSSPAMIG